MSIQELIKNHLEEKCEKCTRKDCNGIHITEDKAETRCDKDE